MAFSNGTRCPSCGEYEVVTLGHDPETGATEPSPEQVAADEGVGHSYCTNCDWGVCAHC
jgi:hypothetical protein